MKITIMAAGTWGVALAKVLSDDNEVIVWDRSESNVSDLTEHRIQKNLPEVMLPESIVFTADMEMALSEADIVIIATPSVAVRATVEKMKPFLRSSQIVVCVAKGIEPGTLYFMSEIINDVLKGANSIVALSGPTHAEEVAADQPTLIVSSSSDGNAARTVQNLFVGTCIRPYTNGDIKGIELCGALKNVIALTCGIAAGLGYGDNTRAAIMTRGLAEIRNLGRKMGCLEETFSGLAGIGDLVVTATSDHSRNNRAGKLIGQGMTAEEAIEEVGMVVEGMNTLPAAMELSKKYDVELPIISVVNDIVNGRLTAEEAMSRLFSRNIRSELSRSESELRYEAELLDRRRSEAH